MAGRDRVDLIRSPRAFNPWAAARDDFKRCCQLVNIARNHSCRQPAADPNQRVSALGGKRALRISNVAPNVSSWARRPFVSASETYSTNENRANVDWHTVERMSYQLHQQVLVQRDLGMPARYFPLFVGL